MRASSWRTDDAQGVPACDAYGCTSPEAHQARVTRWEAHAVYVGRSHDFRRLRDAIEHTSAQLAYAQADDEGRWYMTHDC